MSTSHASPQTPETAGLSTFHIPAEIWLEIFNQCDYTTLKTLQLVCRSFDSLLMKHGSNSQIDKNLFRDKPALHNEYGNVTLHPALNFEHTIWYNQTRGCVSLEFDCTKIKTSGTRLLMSFLRNINTESIVVEENATSPAVERLIFPSEVTIGAKEGYGVTVGDVIVCMAYDLIPSIGELDMKRLADESARYFTRDVGDEMGLEDQWLVKWVNERKLPRKRVRRW